MHDRIPRAEGAADAHGDVVVGFGGARRNAAIAIVRDGDVLMACEQERFTRSKGAGFDEIATLGTLDDMLRLSALPRRTVASYTSAEKGFAFDPAVLHVQFPHAYAHACASFLTSPFESAAILVCDSGSEPEVTVWTGRGRDVCMTEWRWFGPGFARLFSLVTGAFGFAAEREEYRFEALARVGRHQGARTEIAAFHEDRIESAAGVQSTLAAAAAEARSRGLQPLADLASAVQESIGEGLVASARAIRRVTGEENLCVAGGLFYNTFLNSAVANDGSFARYHVPPNPGNPGLALGTALAVSSANSPTRPRRHEQAFLGPAYDDGDVKRQLENCKLTYDYVDDECLTRTVAEALERGRLVAWFQGRMEWGPRALGNRSILANPLSPHVLANLNAYLKQGDDHRTYGVTIAEADAGRLLRQPRASRFMEFEAEFGEPGQFKPMLPGHATRVRYQTIDEGQPRVMRLLEAVGERTGCPMLINTSFNGFHEPIACSPRDAIRIFYGTGLDMLVIGNFILRK